MADTAGTYINLVPVRWSHRISHYPTTNVEGVQLRLTCRTQPGSDLLLSEGYRLRDLEIPLTIFPGELSAKEREHLSPQAIGGIWWLPGQEFVHGWFCFRPSDYAAVSDQVRRGGYEACTIMVNISPVQYSNETDAAWICNPLSIGSAEFSFTREMAPAKAAKRILRTPSKDWAIVLFIMASIAWFFPLWNGLFFEASKDMTTGEGRIVAAVLFVGGLLLWFLGPSRPSERRD